MALSKKDKKGLALLVFVALVFFTLAYLAFSLVPGETVGPNLCRPDHTDNVTFVIVDKTDGWGADKSKNFCVKNNSTRNVAKTSCDAKGKIAHLLRETMNTLQPYERYYVYALGTTGVPSEPDFDLCNPRRGDQANPLINTPWKIQEFYDDQFVEPFMEALPSMVGSSTASQTRLIETLISLQELSKNRGHVRVVILSDLMENSELISFYGHPPEFSRWQDNRSTSAKLDFIDSAEIYFMNRSSISPEREAQVKAFWTSLFTNANIKHDWPTDGVIHVADGKEVPMPKEKTDASVTTVATSYEVTVLPFEGEQQYGDRISSIVSNDLKLNGLTLPSDPQSTRRSPTQSSEVNYKYWKSNGSKHVVTGNVSEQPDGRTTARFRIFDVSKEVQVMESVVPFENSNIRITAHRIADSIYKELTGSRGVSSTKIAFVARKGATFELRVADADGHNAKFVHRHKAPIMSPQWSPDDQQIAYVSFERGRSIIYSLNVNTGDRKVLADFEGSNLAPAWSPNAKRLAFTRVAGDKSQIYLIDVDGSGLQQLSDGLANDSEPQFSPDGRSLLFTSDRSGRAQIHRLDLDGDKRTPSQETWYVENSSAKFSPDAERIVFVRRKGSTTQIAIKELKSGKVRELTKGGSNKAPSFSPNGKMILYSATDNGQEILRYLSIRGVNTKTLRATNHNLSEPAWGPMR